MKIIGQRRHGDAARRGGALILSLVAVGVVGVLAMAFLQLSASVTRRQVGAVDTKLAFYLAEAGLTESYAGVLVGRTGRVGSETDPAVYGEGLLWVERDVIDGDHIELKSTGMAKTGRATLGVVLERGTPNVKGLGVFSLSNLIIGPGTTVDGFDSSVGTYAEHLAMDPALMELARLGSNANVTVSATPTDPTVIKGDVIPGPASSVVEAGDPTITGNTTNESVTAEVFPAIVIPTVPMFGGVTHGAGVPLIVPSGSFGAAYLHLAANSDVTLQGPLTLVLGGLQLASDSQLLFDTTNGAINLYVSNYLDVDPAALLVTTGEKANDVMISIDGDVPVEFESAGPFYGMIYAPDATVVLANGFELFGAVAAATLDIANGATLHYDAALAAIGAEEELPKKVSWRIVDLPQAVPKSLTKDPFDELGVDPDLLANPADAHEDQTIHVRYIPPAGPPAQNYDGLESGFNWNNVKYLLSLKRDGGLVDGDLAEIADDGGLTMTVK